MQLKLTKLGLDGVLVVTPERISDARGFFMETFRASTFSDLRIDAEFVQENQAFSQSAGTVRGLHFQKPPFAQAKLVTALRGSIFDVAVDLRPHSSTFGRWVGATLTETTANQMYIPRGFAHGYCSLQDATLVSYKCDAYYAPGSEGGVLFSDPLIGITWPVSVEQAILSDKDRALPLLSSIRTSLSAD